MKDWLITCWIKKIVSFLTLIIVMNVNAQSVTKQLKAQSGAAVIYDRSSKFDHSFNQAVFENGVIELRKLGYLIKEVEPASQVQAQLGVMKLARRGYNPIIGIGYSVSPAIKRAAIAFPDVSFVIIDNVVDLPNVQSITFHEEQGAYLAGVLAASKSQTGHIGFIGGMDIPLITKFSCGYLLGAQSVSPNIKLTRHYIGSTFNAWNDPSKGVELARHQNELGADVIFAAAGGSGLGVYQAANDHGFYAIAVDSNQNKLYPGAILSSMVKRLGQAVFQAVIDFNDQNWQSGHIEYGLEDNWVGLTRDQYNQFSFSEQLDKTVTQKKLHLLSNIDAMEHMLDRCTKGIE